MLGAIDSIATVAVKNLEEARVYYEEKLGLEVARELPEGITYRTGRTTLLIYASRFERASQELRAKGITFEHYDLPGTTVQDDVHVEGDRKAVWFKDPDGNILSL
jgi:catechol-2,3-dioxygenase